MSEQKTIVRLRNEAVTALLTMAVVLLGGAVVAWVLR
jgi:hypothetical protein